MTAHANEAATLVDMFEADGLPGILVSSHRPRRDIADETLVHLACSSNIDISVRQRELVHIERTEDGTPVIERITKNASRDHMNLDGMEAHATLDHPGIVHDGKAVE